eukprot:Rmarinus@m.22646
MDNPPPEEEHFTGPLSDRLVHKNWKARKEAYEELFQRLNESFPTDAIFDKYGGCFKKAVVDSHAMCQEKAIDAATVFMDRAPNAKKYCDGICSGLVSKGIAGRPNVKKKSCDLLLLCVELDCAESVVEALLKGFTQTNPKTVAGAAECLMLCVREFGSKVVSLKPVVKAVGKLFEHKDKAVRGAAVGLCGELTRWAGAPVLSALDALRPEQVKEIERSCAEFTETLGAPQPQRILRKFQESGGAPDPGSQPRGGGGGGAPAGGGGADQEDDLSLFDPVDLLSKIPSNWADSVLEIKKWNDKIAKMEELTNQVEKTPAISPGEWGTIVKTLRKVCADTNINVSMTAVRTLGLLAAHMKHGFAPYCTSVCDTLLPRLKEKKPGYSKAVATALDSLWNKSYTLENAKDSITKAMNDKNPKVRQDTLSWIARAVPRFRGCLQTKAVFVPICDTAVKATEHPDSRVRDEACAVLGEITKTLGARMMTPVFAKLDDIRKNKVMEIAAQAGDAGAANASG